MSDVPDGVATNRAIPSTELPRLDDIEFEPLDPRHLKVRLGVRLVPLVIGLVAAAVSAIAGAPGWVSLLGAAATLLLVGLSAVAALVETRRMGYAIREQDVSLRRGVITLRTSSIPHHRVQNVSVERGALSRLAGLASVTVSTAAGGSGRLTIPGLANDTAEQLKTLILDRSLLDDES